MVDFLRIVGRLGKQAHPRYVGGMEGQLSSDIFFGVLGAVIDGGLLLGVFFYNLFWADSQIRRGLMTEESLPWWCYAGMLTPMAVGIFCTYSALY